MKKARGARSVAGGRGRGRGGGSRRRDLENDSCLRKRGLLCFSSHGTLYTVPKVPLDLGQVRPLVRSNSGLFGTRSSVGVYPISIQHRCTTSLPLSLPLPPQKGARLHRPNSTFEFSGYFRARRPSNDLRIPTEGGLLPIHPSSTAASTDLEIAIPPRAQGGQGREKLFLHPRRRRYSATVFGLSRLRLALGGA